MQLIRRKPFRSLPGFSNLFDEFFNDEFFNDEAVNQVVPPANIKEGDNDFLVELAIPGVEKGDIDISVNDDTLTISSKKEKVVEDKQEGKYARKEFSFSAFKRMFRLPKTVDAGNISADYKDGVLKVNIPKGREEDKVKRIEIS